MDIEGHRGARGLVVENTLPSMTAALDAGVTGIELDVRMSADGQLVVWHDPILLPEKCRTTRGDLIGARIDELTLDQLRTVDVGSQTLPEFATQRPAPGAQIPTLAEVFTLGEHRSSTMWWTVEVKLDPTDERQVARRERLVEATLAAVHEAGVARRCFVHSFDWAVLDLSGALDPGVLRSALTQARHFSAGSPWTGSIDPAEHGEDLISGVAAVGARVVAPDFALVDADLVRRAHALDISVLTWTVNEPADLTRMLDLGVDGIVTDYPDRALELVSRSRAHRASGLDAPDDEGRAAARPSR
ncbi:MAG: glycerophosphodiester phosphodiesterase family protein [Terracoccus sp.]